MRQPLPLMQDDLHTSCSKESNRRYQLLECLGCGCRRCNQRYRQSPSRCHLLQLGLSELPFSRICWTCCMCWSSSFCLGLGRFFLMFVTHVLSDVILVGGSCPLCLMTLNGSSSMCPYCFLRSPRWRRLRGWLITCGVWWRKRWCLLRVLLTGLDDATEAGSWMGSALVGVTCSPALHSRCLYLAASSSSSCMRWAA